MDFYTVIYAISILQIILMVLLAVGLFYNCFAKKKHWSILFTLLFGFLLLQMYESELYEEEMENLMYDSLYEDYYEPQYVTGSAVVSEYCVSNLYDCGDFTDRRDAQTIFDACGGVNNDVHHFDRDGDGIACEWN
jgi:hypothetical protein